MTEQRNILWTKLNLDNAERIRAALNVPKVERGPNSWVSKVIGIAIADWADEITTNAKSLDKETAWAYSELYANEVYVKKPWDADKRPVLNAAFKPAMVAQIDIIGHELDRLGAAHATARSGYNRAMIVMIALDKYAKKLELTAGLTADSEAT